MLGFFLILPIILTMGSLVFYPLLATFWDSLHRVDPLQQGTPFVGIANYTRVFDDAEVGRSWFNTFKYVLLAVFLETVFGVLAAALINQVKRGRQWVLAAIVLPWALPPVVSAVIWEWIYAPGPGLLNGALTAMGLPFEDFVWFNNSTLALLLITLVHVWRMMPLTIVIVLAAMQGIPGELYEAARMDGSSRFGMFRTITLPLTRGAIAVAMTNATVAAFNLFDEAIVLARNSVETRPILIQIYLEAFRKFHFSYGMALSLMVTAVSLLVSLGYVMRIHKNTRLD
ncbi:carbohydrate ABC transporter permease [Aestuariivirga litoralis]|uniref:carbohydrate ABC transporter permease n=1 Tax=Aestuariivirga litoralis TaxID=2650924 RepID=UPI0018C4BE5A|nr:sugar ABC transporter permease [Aestuariivirga litoralis]MBG1232402.1 sugar ABC transporter permease [Aestuariivirga litoralis]